jgi:DNA-binding LacI/PurR family transcriptional regulator
MLEAAGLHMHVQRLTTHMEIPSQQLGTQAVKLLIELLKTPQQVRHVELYAMLRPWESTFSPATLASIVG